MRSRFGLFAADIERFGPLAIVTVTTLVCLPSLVDFLGHRLALASILERFCVALVFATVGVRLVQHTLLRYARHNIADADGEPPPLEHDPRPERVSS